MNKLTTWFRSRIFLSDMLVRYCAQANALDEENTTLRKKIAQKDDELTRAHDDHRQSNSFHQAVITNMQMRIKLIDKELVEAKAYNEYWREKCEEYEDKEAARDFLAHDLNPETEQDYIDQVMQNEADRA